MRRLYAHYVCLVCGASKQLFFDTLDLGTVDPDFPLSTPCNKNKCKGTARRRDV